MRVIICCVVISTTGFVWFVRRFGRKFLFPRVLPQLHYVHFLSCSKLKSPLKSSPIGSCTERNRDKHDYNLQHGNMMVRELSSFGNFFFSFFIYLSVYHFLFLFFEIYFTIRLLDPNMCYHTLFTGRNDCTKHWVLGLCA